ncbi:hypothetical protein NP233_g1722 [Leucocoprinus birnbaumii]|uniref:Uncharacterized protein n=1 Tax=Leucocoprinus birnbaumii TaxID=56174 RepID=A0AAD5W1M0_9AGAR|nr:hypothetical protein NP233_g1722 [Leucocoprinus birnbaumii]
MPPKKKVRFSTASARTNNENPRWIRTADNSYKLPGETLPVPKDQAPIERERLSKIPHSQLNLINAILSQVYEAWPAIKAAECNETNPEFLCLVWESMKRGFIYHVFPREIKSAINKARNSSQSASHSVLINIQQQFKDNKGFASQIYGKFLRLGDQLQKLETTPESQRVLVGECLRKARAFDYELKRVRYAGQTARKQAIWIGDTSTDFDKESKKHMVETAEQLNLLSTAYSNKHPNENPGQHSQECPAVNVGEKMNRICAPGQDACYSLIFWTKDGPNDDKPSESKIFGGIVYHPEKIFDHLSSDIAQLLKERELSTLFNKFKDQVNRPRFSTAGSMVKATGTHALMPKDKLPKGADHAQKEAKVWHDQIPLFEAYHHEFYQGFLPHLAEMREVEHLKSDQSSFRIDHFSRRFSKKILIWSALSDIQVHLHLRHLAILQPYTLTKMRRPPAVGSCKGPNRSPETAQTSFGGLTVF